MKLFVFTLFLVGISLVLASPEQDDITEDEARVLRNLDSIEEAISDLDEMDEDRLLTALKSQNVGGWFGRRRRGRGQRNRRGRGSRRGGFLSKIGRFAGPLLSGITGGMTGGMTGGC